MDEVTQRLQHGCQQLGVALSRTQLEQLEYYLALLQRWNRVYNLTAVSESRAAVDRHLLDSLAVIPHLPPQVTAGHLLDVGSGGGLPGIPLAILIPTMATTLLDSNRKKSRFLVQVKGELGLTQLNVVECRLEDYHPPYCFEGIISRAFSRLAMMATLCHPHLAEDGVLLAMKGRLEPKELAEVAPPVAVTQTIPLTVPGLEDEQRHLVVLNKQIGNSLWPK